MKKPQLSGLQVKVKEIRKPLYGSGCWWGGRLLMKPEDARGGDEFAMHFRVGDLRRRRLLKSEIDVLMIVELDKQAGFAN